VSTALHDSGMWDESLLVFASDNGGASPIEWANTPLRGAKRTVWEGGIRVVAFISGGFLPAEARGSTQNGLMCLHDLYASFASLAGVTDLQDAPTSTMFPVDALDMSPLLLGQQVPSPRDTVIVGNTPCGADGFASCTSVVGSKTHIGVINAVIHATNNTLYKIVVGKNLKSIDADEDNNELTRCGRAPEDGCMYDLLNDEGEDRSIAAAHPETFAQLLALADGATVYPRPKNGWTMADDTSAVGPFLKEEGAAASAKSKQESEASPVAEHASGDIQAEQ